MLSRFLLSLTGMFLLSTSFSIYASSQPPRWITADDVRVRSGPTSGHKITGTLLRGAKLILKTEQQQDGYCFIEGEGHYGYVACQYLSKMPVARAKAGHDGVDIAQRWVSGNAVVIRSNPHRDAPILTRLGLNAIVKLQSQASSNNYCSIQFADEKIGFITCSYLVDTPVIVVDIRGLVSSDEPLSANYDPVRAFWLEPSWSALEAYAEMLRSRYPNPLAQKIWPKDEALEKMKAHLALGIKGNSPEPYPDWLLLKEKAAPQLKILSHPNTQENDIQSTGLYLQNAIGIGGDLFDAISSTDRKGAMRVINLVNTLELPSVSVSFFKQENEIAPPTSTAEEASGRFGIIFRQITTPRPQAKPNTEYWGGAGFYDMLARTQVLVKPITQVQLYRDGRLTTESSVLRQKEVLWRDVDEEECAGWVGGFAFGDASKSIWGYFGEEAAAQSKLDNNPKGSLYAFYTNLELTNKVAVHSKFEIKLNRDLTGFVKGVHLYYDIDDDGTPDITVWEGEGKGPGHLDGMTTTDDRWYRLVLANIGGKWKILGSDTFNYGCGC